MRSWIGAVSLTAGLLCTLMPVRGAVAQSEEMFITELEASLCRLLQDCSEIMCDFDAIADDDAAECTYNVSSAQTCLDEFESLDCDSFVGGITLSAACADVYDCPPCLDDDELFEGVGEASRGIVGDTDTLCDNVDTSVNRDPTKNSADSAPAMPGAGDHTETRGVLSIETTLDAEQLRSAFGNGSYPCGPGINGLTLCATGGAALEAGRYVIVQNVLEAAVPRNDPGRIYQYGFVFDADGDESNNYVPSPQYPNDFFRGTDRWYDAAYDASGSWTLTVTDARDGNFVSVQSDARLIVNGNTLTLVVPASEFSTVAPSYRVTSFCHTGDYGQIEPYDWSGDTEPPGDQPLRQTQDLTDDPGTAEPGGEEPGDFPQDDDGCGCRALSPSDRPTATTNVLLALFVTLIIARRRRSQA